MDEFIKTESQVYHMELDKSKRGLILFSDGSSLKRVNQEGQVFHITGKATTKGYKDGKDGDARFNEITGFVQIPLRKSWAVVVADKDNDCLRVVDRLRKQKVRTFAGQCRQLGFKNSILDLEKGLFNKPHSIIADMKAENQLVITDKSNDAVRMISYPPYKPGEKIGLSGNLTTLFKSAVRLHSPRGIVQSMPSGDYYIAVIQAIVILRYSDHKVSYMTPRVGITYPYEMIFVSDSHMLAGSVTFLTLINSTQVTRLCNRVNKKYQFVPGNLYNSSCRMYYPYSLLLSADRLYVGQRMAINVISSAGE